MTIRTQQQLGYKVEMIRNKVFRKIQGNYKFNHEWNRSLGRTDHTSETSINMKEKSARREILDEWLTWYSFQAGEVTGCSENQSLFWLHSHECSSAGELRPLGRLEGLWMKDFCSTPSMTEPQTLGRTSGVCLSSVKWKARVICVCTAMNTQLKYTTQQQ